MISVKFLLSLGKLLLELNFAKTKNNTIENKFRNSIPWFKYECQLARKNLRKRKRKFKNNRTSANHEEMKLFDKKYKNRRNKNMRLIWKKCH